MQNSKLQNGKKNDKRQNGIQFESLESRQMMSASAASTVFPDAVSLGNVSVNTQLHAHGVVGGSVEQVIYAVNATKPVTLNASLGNLQQTDTLSFFLPSGTLLSSQTSSGSHLSVSQPVLPGTCYVEVTAQDSEAAPTAARTTTHLSASIRNFTLQVKGTTYVAEKGANAGVTNSNEPLTITQGQEQSGIIPMTYEQVSGSLFGTNNVPSPNDVLQGMCGDCWFLSTLSSIARNDPGLIEQDIVSLGNNEYKVGFGNASSPTWVTIDGTLPEFQTKSGNWALAFAEEPSDGALWAPLMEKAFCYYRHAGQGPASYATIEGGHGAEALADLGSTSVSEAGTLVAPIFGFRATMVNGAQLANQIRSWQNSGLSMVLDTLPEGYTSSICGSHQYSIVGVDANGNIVLRNPWGYNPVSARNPYGPSIQDGGYITLTPTAVYNDCEMMFAGVMPQVAPAPLPNPIPVPTPTPTPAPQTSSVSGTVFSDLYNDGNLDAGDPGIAGVVVYATTTPGAPFQSNDPSATTNASGAYTISGLAVGTTYYIYEVTPAGYSNNSGFNYTPQAGYVGVNDNFANVPPSYVTGNVFFDSNGNGVLDNGEAGIAGVTIFASTSPTGRYQAGDQTAVTDANGNYSLNGLKVGTTYYIYEINPAGYSTGNSFNFTPTAGYHGCNDNFANVLANG